MQTLKCLFFTLDDDIIEVIFVTLEKDQPRVMITGLLTRGNYDLDSNDVRQSSFFSIQIDDI